MYDVCSLYTIVLRVWSDDLCVAAKLQQKQRQKATIMNTSGPSWLHNCPRGCDSYIIEKRKKQQPYPQPQSQPQQQQNANDNAFSEWKGKKEEKIEKEEEEKLQDQHDISVCCS